MIDLGRPFPPGRINRIPPHSSRRDAEIWNAWAPRGLRGALRVWYDVGIGDAPPCPEWADEDLRRCWWRVNCRRIDAVAEFPGRVEIIEFKHLANPSSIGRLLLYMMLWEREAGEITVKPAIAHLVTNRRDKDLEDLARKYNVLYTIVGE